MNQNINIFAIFTKYNERKSRKLPDCEKFCKNNINKTCNYVLID